LIGSKRDKGSNRNNFSHLGAIQHIILVELLELIEEKGAYSNRLKKNLIHSDGVDTPI